MNFFWVLNFQQLCRVLGFHFVAMKGRKRKTSIVDMLHREEQVKKKMVEDLELEGATSWKKLVLPNEFLNILKKILKKNLKYLK